MDNKSPNVKVNPMADPIFLLLAGCLAGLALFLVKLGDSGNGWLEIYSGLGVFGIMLLMVVRSIQLRKKAQRNKEI